MSSMCHGLELGGLWGKGGQGKLEAVSCAPMAVSGLRSDLGR